MSSVGVGLPIGSKVEIAIGSDIKVTVRYRRIDGVFLVDASVPEGVPVIVRDAATLKDSIAKAKSNGNHRN